jgi:hypothetical protein
MELVPIAAQRARFLFTRLARYAITASRSAWAQFAGLKGTSHRRAIGLAERRICGPKGVPERRFYSPV